MRTKDELGRHGEDLAAAYLTRHGLQLLRRNWRCPRGEIDIVARDGETLVFCEVKTRATLAFGDPSEAVGYAKATRLRGLGLQWLLDNPGHWAEIRFDVVSVLSADGVPDRVRHVRGAF